MCPVVHLGKLLGRGKGLSLAIAHFTLQDVLSCTAATLAFSPFFLAPGYFLGYFLDLFRFRDASWRERLLLSVVLSLAITPISATIIGRISSLWIVCGLCVLVTVVDALLIARELHARPQRFQLARETKIGFAIAFGWAVVAILSLVDLQIGERLYLPAAAFDQSLRSSLTGAAVRTGVPPANPFFYPGHFVALRYYYYWNVLCALPAKLFGLTARSTALSGVVWSGLALASLVPICLKHFCEETVDLGKKSLIGIALLAVTGLDLIPTLVSFLARHSIYADMEWWDGTQVASWTDSLLWVPHQVACVVACVVGFLVLWAVPRHAPFGARMKAAVVAALAFASAAGLSVYVTFTFAIFLVVWTLVLLRSRHGSEVWMFFLTGVLTLVVSLGYLHDLRQPGWTGSFATFYVRTLESVEDWAEQAIPWDWVHSLFLVLLLPVYYLIELGFFALVGFGQIKNFWRRAVPLMKWEWASICICGSSFLVATFLMSTTGNNDLGYRSILLAQFILLLWAVPYVYRWRMKLSERRSQWHLLFYTFAWIGVLGTLYQLAELRVFTMIAEQGRFAEEITWLPQSETLGADVFRARSGFEVLNHALPQDAIIQYNPVNPVYVPNIYYSREQKVAGLAACGTPFGGDPFQCVPIQNQILAAFNGRTAFTMQNVNQLCDDLHIDLLIAERSDRMWSLRQSWVWTGKPVVANEYMRAFACGARRSGIEKGFEIGPLR